MDIAIVRERMGQVETFKNQNKIAREALKNELENNPEYLAVCEEMKALADKKKRMKEAIWSQAETQKIAADIKENNTEIGTLEEILSAELVEYYQDAKTDEIKDQDGEVRKFKLIAKILPKKAKYDDRDIDGKYMAKVEPDLASISSPE